MLFDGFNAFESCESNRYRYRYRYRNCTLSTLSKPASRSVHDLGDGIRNPGARAVFLRRPPCPGVAFAARATADHGVDQNLKKWAGAGAGRNLRQARAGRKLL